MKLEKIARPKISISYFRRQVKHEVQRRSTMSINIKALTAVFGIGLAGVAVSLVMSIYTGVSEYQEKTRPKPLTLPVPAIPQE
ncbi:MAG: hypothetical protein HYX41_06050 [Bdellovibrio sp.]|nr:hypothetical protein [Bdellovibrio sp.]